RLVGVHRDSYRWRRQVSSWRRAQEHTRLRCLCPSSERRRLSVPPRECCGYGWVREGPAPSRAVSKRGRHRPGGGQTNQAGSKGVWASVSCKPLPDNKFIGSKPGFNSEGRGGPTDKKDGRFRFVTIPGKALLHVQVHEGIKFNGEHLCVYRKAGPDPDHKELF